MDLEFVFGLVTAIAIVAIVMGTIGGIVKSAIRLREKRLELNARPPQSDAAPLLVKINQMEDRIRVLESIASDSGARLAQEIEALRLTADVSQKGKEEVQ
jgi:hypothetical protein